MSMLDVQPSGDVCVNLNFVGVGSKGHEVMQSSGWVSTAAIIEWVCDYVCN